MRAKLPNNWGHYNPNRRIPTGKQGGSGGRHPKGSIDLHSAIHRQMSMASPTLRRILERLYLHLKQEGSTYTLCKGDLVLYSSTDPHYAKAQRQV